MGGNIANQHFLQHLPMVLFMVLGATEQCSKIKWKNMICLGQKLNK